MLIVLQKYKNGLKFQIFDGYDLNIRKMEILNIVLIYYQNDRKWMFYVMYVLVFEVI